MDADSDNCTQKHAVGEWKGTVMTIKKIPKVYENIGEEYKSTTKFFDGLILQNNATIIVGIIMTDKETSTRRLVFATLSVPPRLNTKEALSFEHHIDKLHYLVSVPKGTVVVRVKLLLRHPNTTNQFFLAPNTKMSSFPIYDLIDPTPLILTDTSINRQTYIKYTVNDTIHTDSRLKISTQKTYSLDESIINWFTSQL